MLAALAVVSLSACGSGADEPVAASTVISPSVPVPVASATSGIRARLVDRTGRWQATVGEQTDQGDLTIHYRCAGGGTITVGTSLGARAESPCDGVTRLSAASSGVPAGTVAVTVEPDGVQRWSLLVVRGPATQGDHWPAGASEIEPGRIRTDGG
ncbi:hypothetical protein [Actinoplanes flavus]|uniref:Secreted protein n=1 Tax=Actinoplanes flavus TaxID=2820290 RepID=A0ABS3UIK0_9ACTN|nr:hypothetical protein [Actinoplanes flavus]MBO3738615.1 hypothetical protein [Actinoplanes flavus]